MIKAGKPQSIIEEIKFPSRSCGHLNIKNYPLSERSKRSPLYSGLRLYNAIPMDFKVLPQKVLKKRLKKYDIDYNPFKDSR